MNILHITQTKNVESILKNGILRCKPLLSQYGDIMEEEYESEYNKERGLVFCIPEEIDRRDKYIKDFFYWKTWGDDRNRFICKNEDIFDKLEEGYKVFSHIKSEPIQFSIFLLDIPEETILTKYYHAQYNSMGDYSLWKDMDTRYEHDYKPLALVNYDINADNIKKIIGIGESILTKDNKINTLLQI